MISPFLVGAEDRLAIIISSNVNSSNNNFSVSGAKFSLLNNSFAFEIVHFTQPNALFTPLSGQPYLSRSVTCSSWPLVNTGSGSHSDVAGIDNLIANGLSNLTCLGTGLSLCTGENMCVSIDPVRQFVISTHKIIMNKSMTKCPPYSVTLQYTEHQVKLWSAGSVSFTQ